MSLKHLSACAALAILMGAPLSAEASQGLNGAYYQPLPDQGIGVSPGGPGSIAEALALIEHEAPTATFTATTVCFPSCGGQINDSGSTLTDFLGGNATNLSSDPVTDLSNHLVVLTGFLDIATTGLYNFGLQSDDGSEILINNSVLTPDDGGDHGLSGPVYENVSLTKGFVPIEIIQFEDGGATGLTVDMSQSLDNLGSSPLGGAEISTSAPEPAAWALMLLGVGAIGAAMRFARNERSLTRAAALGPHGA
jgi:hypothetical protein